MGLGRPYCVITGEHDNGPVGVVAKEVERKGYIPASMIPSVSSWPLWAPVSALPCHSG